MWSFRRSRGRRFDPEALLRAERSYPRDEFVRELTARVEGARRPTPWSRVAFAAAASTFILGMFATVGGFAYVASGATATYSVAKQVVVKHKLSVSVHESAASKQYPGTPNPPNPPHNNVAGTQNQQAAGVAGVASAKSLPFTGISLLGTVLLGVALLTLGLIMRRRERRET
jgi:hypothetical protein